jgi:type VI secretion system protein ImpA
MNEDVRPNSNSAAVEEAGGHDLAVASLCVPVADGDQPCGPDLDQLGDADYLNFFAQVEGILPGSFFDALDGTPFDPASVSIDDQLVAIKPLIQRTRDIRLLVIQARVQILNRDLAGFGTSLAAVAYWLNEFWDQVHPVGEAAARINAIETLDIPTVTFSLQYAPLFEAPRLGTITYRSLLIATGEAKARAGEQKLDAAPILEARATANTATLGAVCESVAMVRSAIDQIRNAFVMHGAAAGLDNLSQLVGKIQAFIDPVEATKASAAEADGATSAATAGPGPRSCAEARDSLAAVADYYSRHEPSSPTLPLVRQAHQLIGKSFLEVIRILVPAHLEKAAFQIGGDRIFDLPIERLPNLDSDFAPSHGDFVPSHRDFAPSHHVAPSIDRQGQGEGQNPGEGEKQDQDQDQDQDRDQDRDQDQDQDQDQGTRELPPSPLNVTPTPIQVSSRAQAIALLDQVQRYFQLSEPSSPVPMLCERARAFAERDFMAVLREVLPKAALRDIGVEK